MPDFPQIRFFVVLLSLSKQWGDTEIAQDNPDIQTAILGKKKPVMQEMGGVPGILSASAIL